MLQLELPHVNVLSKCDLIEKFGKLSFNLDFYTDVLDLGYLLDELEVRCTIICFLIVMITNNIMAGS